MDHEVLFEVSSVECRVSSLNVESRVKCLPIRSLPACCRKLVCTGSEYDIRIGSQYYIRIDTASSEHPGERPGRVSNRASDPGKRATRRHSGAPDGSGLGRPWSIACRFEQGTVCLGRVAWPRAVRE